MQVSIIILVDSRSDWIPLREIEYFTVLTLNNDEENLPSVANNQVESDVNIIPVTSSSNKYSENIFNYNYNLGFLY